MSVLLAIGSGAALGLIGGACLSVLWLVAFWPIVFGSTFVVARFEGYSYGVTLVWAIGAVMILQAAYLAGALLRPPRNVPSERQEKHHSPRCDKSCS